MQDGRLSMTKEKTVQDRIRLAAARHKAILWRNNTGAVHTDDGRFIRFGLANDSKSVNRNVKSSDLIGIKSVTITPDMVGKTVGVFVAREVKRPGWRYSGTDREVAQKRFIDIVNRMGGDAKFETKGEF